MFFSRRSISWFSLVSYLLALGSSTLLHSHADHETGEQQCHAHVHADHDHHGHSCHGSHAHSHAADHAQAVAPQPDEPVDGFKCEGATPHGDCAICQFLAKLLIAPNDAPSLVLAERIQPLAPSEVDAPAIALRLAYASRGPPKVV